MSYKVYYTLDGVCQSATETDMGVALKVSEDLRRRRREGENISHITMVSENPDMVGQQGVDTIADGKTPDGVPYTWVKRRPPDSPKFTTGHCANHAQPGGCQLHNLQCGYPACDRKPT